MPELNALRYLIEVSKTNSINKAANDLFIFLNQLSPPRSNGWRTNVKPLSLTALIAALP